MTRSTRLEVDLDAIAHNLSELVRLLDAGPVSPSRSPRKRPLIAAVVKANAYGMGAAALAPTLVEGGADLLAVACLPEALELRRVLPGARVLIMGHTPDEYLSLAVEKGIAVTIFDLRQARILSRAAAELRREAIAHAKIDTGMNRLGLKPGPEAPELLAAMSRLTGLRIEGAFSHLALRDRDSDRRQFELFGELLAEAAALGAEFPIKHICDSIGMMRYPEYRLDMVRVGAFLYGVKPLRTPLGESVEIRAPFALATRISRIRKLAEGEGVGYDATFIAPAGGSRIATLPIGYADGYMRCLSNKAQVLIRGKRAPVVGLICMDQLTVDVGGIPEAEEGDEVLLLGRRARRPGSADAPGPADAESAASGEIGVLELANWAGTNRNEIISAIGRRVPRVYLRGGSIVGSVDYLET